MATRCRRAADSAPWSIHHIDLKRGGVDLVRGFGPSHLRGVGAPPIAGEGAPPLNQVRLDHRSGTFCACLCGWARIRPAMSAETDAPCRDPIALATAASCRHYWRCPARRLTLAHLSILRRS